MSDQEHPHSHPAHPSGNLRTWKPRPLSRLLPHTPPEPPADRFPRDKTILFNPSMSKATIHPAETHVIHRALLAMDYHILAPNHFLPEHHPLHSAWTNLRGWKIKLQQGDKTLTPSQFINRHHATVPDPSDPFAELPPRVDAINIVLTIRRHTSPEPPAKRKTASTMFEFPIPSDICIPIRNYNAWNALEDTPPILTRDADIDPEELALLLELTLFDTDYGNRQDQPSRMYQYNLAFETALANFRTYAGHIARRTILGATAAARETIAELSRRYIGWAIPPGHSLRMKADSLPGADGVCVELDPD